MFLFKSIHRNSLKKSSLVQNRKKTRQRKIFQLYIWKGNHFAIYCCISQVLLNFVCNLYVINKNNSCTLHQGSFLHTTFHAVAMRETVKLPFLENKFWRTSHTNGFNSLVDSMIFIYFSLKTIIGISPIHAISLKKFLTTYIWIRW